jgi:hypothetical protein
MEDLNLKTVIKRGLRKDAQPKALLFEAVAPTKTDSSANIRTIDYREVNPRMGHGIIIASAHTDTYKNR